MVYPFFVDDTATFYSSSSDGYIKWESDSYSYVRDRTSGAVYDTLTSNSIGQRYYNDRYAIYRAFFFFDTSSIPSSANIDSASLHLYILSDKSNTDFDITVQNGQPNYPHDPLESGDYDRTHYSGNGGSLNTSNLTSGYNTIDLNSDGISWIQKDSGAKTELCLRSSRDINGYTPTDEEFVRFYSNEQGSGYQPYLEVTYIAGTNVTITVPLVNINVNANAPAISTQKSPTIQVPTADISVNAKPPAVSIPSIIQVPTANINVEGKNTSLTRDSIIDVPKANIDVDGKSATLKRDSSISVPKANIDVSGNDINLIMLNGAIIGWYNIVDIYKLYNCIRKPIIVVSYEESEGIEKYIKKYFPQDYKERLELYRKLGEREMIKIKTGYKVYIRYIGIDKKQAIVALNRLTLNGSIPEPLRVAKILAHAAIKAKQ